MKKFFLLFMLISFSSYSQIGGEDEVYLNGDIINPTFNGGGIEKFYEFVNKTFNFSTVQKSGKMVTSFTVNELGEIKNVKVTQLIDVETATEIIRVLKLSPKWQPAKKNGKAISIDIKLPLDLKVLEPIGTKEEETIKSGVLENTETDEAIIAANNLEEKPEYPGGIMAFYALIRNNFKAPDQPGLNGKVIISFVVEKDGTLTDFKILKDLGFGAGKEAIRVLKLSPLWTPAKQKSIPVRCLYTIPITINTPR